MGIISEKGGNNKLDALLLKFQLQNIDDIQFFQFPCRFPDTLPAVLLDTSKAAEVEERVFAIGELSAICQLEACLCLDTPWRNPCDIHVCEVDRGWKARTFNRSGGGNFNAFTSSRIQVL